MLEYGIFKCSTMEKFDGFSNKEKAIDCAKELAAEYNSSFVVYKLEHVQTLRPVTPIG